MRSPTRYARSGDVNIAYQSIGEGELDLVFVPGWVSHVELWSEHPAPVRMVERLTSFARVIIFDKRGTGLSDRVAELPTLEDRMDDVRAVMDAVGSERAALFGFSEGGAMAALFAATYPDRTKSLILYGSMARGTEDEDYPWAPPAEVFDLQIKYGEANWGDPNSLEIWAPSVAEDPVFREWYSRLMRNGASPGAAAMLMRMSADIDIRHILGGIRVPTLILHRKGDRVVNYRTAAYLAEQIPGARHVILPGDDHLLVAGDMDAALDEVERFLTGELRAPDPDRVLATVMFTDIVKSTERASAMGDHRWREVLETHSRVMLKEIERFRGKPIKSTGDGFLATFDGPARGVRCAWSARDELAALDIPIRAGLHTGECEIVGADVGGIAVHIARRVADSAAEGEVFVSSTVKDLIAGSGIVFADRGVHTLKGVEDPWRLLSVTSIA